MNRFLKIVFALNVICIGNLSAQNNHFTVQSWLTTPDKSALFSKQEDFRFTNVNAKTGDIIRLNENKTFQSIDGFGYCLTGGSAQLISQMDPKAQDDLLKELFGTDKNNIGISYLRISIGASDLDDKVFSYDDLPAGETDPKLEKFSLENDRRTGLIPILKKILKINPKIKIMGSPWSPPVWMKDNGDTRGGSLKPEFYGTYANYFVMYIKWMKLEGITIDAVTVQNEPLHPGNNPSLLMLAKDQKVFVRDNLGPAFEKAGVKTKIIVYDHNCDKPEYPLEILDDAAAKKFVDGSAFHLYGGTIDAMSKVHDAHPDKNIYFTEQWTGGPGDFPNDLKWNVENLLIGATQNWAKTVLQWNLASDLKYDPHTDRGGCTSCMGAVTIDGSKVTRNVAYYHMAHAAKFVRPGSKRIETTQVEGLANVAFKTPDGKFVLVVVNKTNVKKNFWIALGGNAVGGHLPAGSVITYVF
ncbi:glycoside hydrolase family 30 protein [Flavobacterium silvaticum]|uniref:Glucosylceramidase n=1 Tax=Flavobacterium silvaticum TaxID=1852020 RepID=A0A972JHZ1_9FLAO|nr:glycoside hydrolase family 30 beta sandwich domain-containing protein [Flavobacterium silvaticum]NMH26757.1 glucosylceramidase [Flavobacterium silvaticum]